MPRTQNGTPCRARKISWLLTVARCPCPHPPPCQQPRPQTRLRPPHAPRAEPPRSPRPPPPSPPRPSRRARSSCRTAAASCPGPGTRRAPGRGHLRRRALPRHEVTPSKLKLISAGAFAAIVYGLAALREDPPSVSRARRHRPTRGRLLQPLRHGGRRLLAAWYIIFPAIALAAASQTRSPRRPWPGRRRCHAVPMLLQQPGR